MSNSAIKKIKVMHIVGARPNFMKVAPIMKEMSKYPQMINQILVHTGQHYDENMSKIFFENIDLPDPDIYLGVGSGSHAQQTSRIMLAFEPLLLKHKPEWVIVVGDVNSTVACALTSAKLGIRVAHIEAGLRSFDSTMPEEINRVITDHIADFLFTTEMSANKNLSREGISKDKIHFVGNVMIDTLLQLIPKTHDRPILSKLSLIKKLNKKKEQIILDEDKKEVIPSNLLKKFVLVTLHRPSNVDNEITLREIVLALSDISKNMPVIFVAHPRTQKRMKQFNFRINSKNLSILEPLGYIDFLALMRSASLVITDSGGIQEETTFLGIPCLTIRPNTERPITIELGINQLVPNKRKLIVDAAFESLKKDWNSNKKKPPLWDGHAAQRIVKTLLR